MAQTTVVNTSTELDSAYGRLSGRDGLPPPSTIHAIKRKAEDDRDASLDPTSTVDEKEPGDDARPLKRAKNDEESASNGEKGLTSTQDEKLGDLDAVSTADVTTDANVIDTTHKATIEGVPSATAPKRSGRFSFEQLPGEVRSMIYRMLFIEESSIRPLCCEDRFMENRGTAQPHSLGAVVPFLRASRRVNAEASEVLYGKNKFVCYAEDYGESTLHWLRSIGKHNKDTIRNIELDWQHGIRKAHQTSKANELFAMVNDPENPMRGDLAKMLHDIARDSILKFSAALDMFSGSPCLEHLTIICPGTDNPGHPDNNCVEYQDCPGCHQELPRVMVKIQGLKSLTVGDADWYNELEALGRLMNVEVINVTQVDCIDVSPECKAELQSQGWSFTITWRDPDGDDFRRVSSKRLAGTETRKPSDNAEF